METNSIVLKEVRDTQAPEIRQVKQTYESAFPKEERRDFELVKAILNSDSRFHLRVLFRDSRYAGFITDWDFGEFHYAEHFAVDASQRNGGIGSQALKAYLASLNKPVVLEVELPNDDLSRRRIGFYERLGFQLDTHTYFQPPYRQGDAELEMRLMSYGPLHLEKNFEQVKQTLHKEVYGVNH